MYRFTRIAGVCLAVATLAALTGCSGTLRENYQRDLAANHVYRKELAEVWPHVQATLRDKGYSWRENPGKYVLETEWLDSGGGTLGPVSSSRFLVEGVRHTSGGCVLRVMRGDRISQDIGVGYTDGSKVRTRADLQESLQGNGGRGKLPTEQRYARDLELELELLQRIDPEGAAKLEEDAKRAHP
ncbi:hypothetical protein [Pyxidicoccus xibeiensis]|uniref:hypothetical protein n=1 Tax=Pyxidicoccus xibeiensis TaxID=2906759 RepID=UPI0020A72604|nr:hypothetical protein [Pyxidicoccus xibeiensis]MCP3142853.1 hypothetical protein [Pyxidicoccus xibeiensis]